MNRAVVIGTGVVGGAVALHLRSRGYRVATGGHAELELTDLDSVERFFQRVGHFDVLVNAAGSYGAVGRVREVPPQAWRRALEVNLLGVYACCYQALARMTGAGHIINIAGGGRGGLPMRSGYAAAKSALWRFTETLQSEEPELCVNAIAPGPMDSRMQDAVAALDEPWAEFVREMRESGAGAVPVANSLRVMDHILRNRPKGQLFFARDFSQEAAQAA